MSEDIHIARWLQQWPKIPLPVGPGDDCAVLPLCPEGQQLIWKTDAVVQDVHFKLSDSSRSIGHKALARVLSDFAAMGATPQSILVTLGVPEKLPLRRIGEAYRGMATLAKEWKLSLAGGETTRSKDWWISISGLGSVAKGKAILRSGAQAGDFLFVTGKLGGSFPKRHLRFIPRLKEGLWLGRQGLASAMMDLSDGLGKDLPRLAAASKVSYRIEAAALPLHRDCTVVQAINDGEDYELLFAVKPDSVTKLRRSWPFTTPLSCIGGLGKATLPHVKDGLTFQGYDHFEK